MSYSEADTKAKLITPKLRDSGWEERYITREKILLHRWEKAGWWC